MSFILSEEIEKYVEVHSTPASSLLNELMEETCKRTEYSNMLSGPVEGRLLQMLIQVGGFKRVLEIGTFTGYSALTMAEALPLDGELVTCEIEEKFAKIALEFFIKSPQGRKIRLVMGPALQALKKYEEAYFDMVFIDADKVSYIRYYEESLRIVRKGGLIVADNALWKGSVLNPDDENSQAIADFNRYVNQDFRVDNCILTVRDGIHLIRKKGLD